MRIGFRSGGKLVTEQDRLELPVPIGRKAFRFSCVSRSSTGSFALARSKEESGTARFELTEQTRQAVDDYLTASLSRLGEHLFPGRSNQHHLTTRQYARLVSDWIGRIGLDPSLFGTHSLRRTKATLESTVRYLGIEVDDALAIFEQVDV